MQGYAPLMQAFAVSRPVKLFDGNAGTAMRLKNLLEENNLSSENGGGIYFHSSSAGIARKYRGIYEDMKTLCL